MNLWARMESYMVSRKQRRRAIVVAWLFLIFVAMAWEAIKDVITMNLLTRDTKYTASSSSIHVFSTEKINFAAILRRTTGHEEARSFVVHSEDPRSFVETYGHACLPPSQNHSHSVLKAYNAMEDVYLQRELWKYCALTVYGGLYVDGVLLNLPIGLGNPSINRNYAVAGSIYDNTVHGSFMFLDQPGSSFARDMVALLTECAYTGCPHPLQVHRTAYDLIVADSNNETMKKMSQTTRDDSNWVWLQQRCSSYEHRLRQQAHRYDRTQACPSDLGYCCEIIDPTDPYASVLLMSRYPVHPSVQTTPSKLLPVPFAFRHNKQDPPKGTAQVMRDNTADDEEEYRTKLLPYIGTVDQTTFPAEVVGVSHVWNGLITPNFYEMLVHLSESNDESCVPSGEKCSNCLRNKAGANCQTCAVQCGCYCETLCHTRPLPKFVTKHVTIRPPRHRKDPGRFIPRIIHQTWFEPVTPEKYPNLSRFIESWRQSGWEYRFYDDDDSVEFLQQHFPPEVYEAYNTLIPGAFRADLFRYCVLLIHGGVYADVDLMLESNLDTSFADDVSFAVPMDEPGTPVNRRACLWNGLLGAAPAHPFIVRAVETAVHRIRNRFTSVDVDDSLCPDPELSISHAFDTLFTTGPCMLGSAVNSVLGRHPQTPFVPGDLDLGDPDGATSAHASKRGRSVILAQNKVDMGAHRFTWLEQNLIVAATDMPDYDDRKTIEEQDKVEHYSKAHTKVGIYGMQNLYHDDVMANEEIRFIILDDKDYTSKQQ